MVSSTLGPATRVTRLAGLPGAQVVFLVVSSGHYRFRANVLGITSVVAIELRAYPTRESLHDPVSEVDRFGPD